MVQEGVSRKSLSHDMFLGYIYIEPDGPLFWSQNMVFSYQNRGQMGSRYIYIYIFRMNVIKDVAAHSGSMQGAFAC